VNREILFQPLTIAGLELPNRVLMTTIKLGYGTPQGEVTKRHIAFYVRRAEGDVGLITTAPLYIHPNGRELPTQLGVHEDRLLGGLRRLTDAVHAASGLVMAHINHAGRAANPKLVPEGERVSASDVLCPVKKVNPRSLTLEEIPTYINYFAEAARRVREAGFDAIKIPFSHGYLIHQFLSPHTNRRHDEYGGSLENRMRFGREVIAAVREAVGDNASTGSGHRFPVVVRMNAQDYVEGGLTIEDAEEMAPILERIGVDALSVTSGTMCESAAYCLYPIGTPKAHLLPMSGRIRSRVSIPVAVAGRIRTPDVAREALALGQTDWIGLGRPFLADPDWVRKTQAGDEVAILRCAACHQGCLTELRKGHGTTCLFNPLTGRESEVWVTPAKRPRRVMVAGGGPAGMEGAMIAAQRGHRVTLYEGDDRLGGRFREAAQVPYKEEFADLIRYQQVQLQRTGVEVVRFETDEQGLTTVVARPWPHQEGASELRFPAETVIIGMALRGDRYLADALTDQPDVHAIGDCVKPCEVLDAIYEGFEAGRTV
jgi:2,4-dienoyl-CoA reductase-like NADH-dependent reductase (Old Yellow Enzyme family)